MISYASTSLMRLEAKYPVLCLKWAITKQFHKYLYGNTFDVYTDNNPLTYVSAPAKLDAMGHRWITSMANYNFHMHYKSGKSNVEADALSRIDWKKYDKVIQADSIQAIVATAFTGHGASHIDAIPCSPEAIESILPSTPEDTLVISKAIIGHLDRVVQQVQKLSHSYQRQNQHQTTLVIQGLMRIFH